MGANPPAVKKLWQRKHADNTPGAPPGLAPLIDGISRDPIRVTGAAQLTQLLGGERLGRKGQATCPSCGGSFVIRQGGETTIFVCCYSECPGEEIYAAIQDRGLMLGIVERS